jgi:hypothetical protein
MTLFGTPGRLLIGGNRFHASVEGAKSRAPQLAVEVNNVSRRAIKKAMSGTDQRCGEDLLPVKPLNYLLSH